MLWVGISPALKLYRGQLLAQRHEARRDVAAGNAPEFQRRFGWNGLDERNTQGCLSRIADLRGRRDVAPPEALPNPKLLRGSVTSG
jgi:hypothetical protein